jgi:hypothetical protein
MPSSHPASFVIEAASACCSLSCGATLPPRGRSCKVSVRVAWAKPPSPRSVPRTALAAHGGEVLSVWLTKGLGGRSQTEEGGQKSGSGRGLTLQQLDAGSPVG